MGGNRAAYATAAPVDRVAETRHRSTAPGLRSGVHSIRKVQLARQQQQHSIQHHDYTSGESGEENVPKPKVYGRQEIAQYAADKGGAGYDYGDDGDGDGDDDFDDDDFDDDEEEEELAERERELLHEREEMKARFTFKEDKRRNLKSSMMDAMRRKRRLLMRNENLRFRELYKPPEPQVVITVVALVTIVTLILTKSWPFY